MLRMLLRLESVQVCITKVDGFCGWQLAALRWCAKAAVNRSSLTGFAPWRYCYVYPFRCQHGYWFPLQDISKSLGKTWLKLIWTAQRILWVQLLNIKEPIKMWKVSASYFPPATLARHPTEMEQDLQSAIPMQVDARQTSNTLISYRENSIWNGDASHPQWTLSLAIKTCY